MDWFLYDGDLKVKYLFLTTNKFGSGVFMILNNLTWISSSSIYVKRIYGKAFLNPCVPEVTFLNPLKTENWKVVFSGGKEMQHFK